jgi:hypothetical protein
MQCSNQFLASVSEWLVCLCGRPRRPNRFRVADPATRNVRRDLPRLIACEELGRRAPSRLVLDNSQATSKVRRRVEPPLSTAWIARYFQVVSSTTLTPPCGTSRWLMRAAPRRQSYVLPVRGTFRENDRRRGRDHAARQRRSDSRSDRCIHWRLAAAATTTRRAPSHRKTESSPSQFPNFTGEFGKIPKRKGKTMSYETPWRS